jgi:cytochrome bd-type quinol oxidase subunit 1
MEDETGSLLAALMAGKKAAKKVVTLDKEKVASLESCSEPRSAAASAAPSGYVMVRP